MTTPTGSYSPRKSLSSAIEPPAALTARKLAYLLGLGLAIIALEQLFRFPLHLPGHHGLEAMAVMILGRLSGGHRASATLVGTGAATGALALGVGHGAMTPLFYLVPGLVIDTAFRLGPGLAVRLWFLPLVAAFAHATKPLMRWGVAEATGVEFGSLVNGAAWPLATHLAFGFTGGLVAVLLWRSRGKRPVRVGSARRGR